jgi:hypothetical protein
MGDMSKMITKWCMRLWNVALVKAVNIILYDLESSSKVKFHVANRKVRPYRCDEEKI